MNYTTLEHAYERCNVLDADGVANVTPVLTREISRIVAGVSQRMDRCMNRGIQVVRKVEHVAAPFGRILFVNNPLIRSVESVDYDPTGLFSSSSGFSTLVAGTDYTVDPDGYRIHMIMAWPMSFPIPCKPLRVTYLGGYAWHTDRTVYAVDAVTGTPAPGKYEQADERIFELVSYDSVLGRVTFKADTGTFSTGDVLDVSGDPTPATITLGQMVEASIVNDFSALETACLMQVAYEYERRFSAGKRSLSAGNGETTYVGEYGLLKEVDERCQDFKLYAMPVA